MHACEVRHIHQFNGRFAHEFLIARQSAQIGGNRQIEAMLQRIVAVHAVRQRYINVYFVERQHRRCRPSTVAVGAFAVDPVGCPEQLSKCCHIEVGRGETAGRASFRKSFHDRQAAARCRSRQEDVRYGLASDGTYPCLVAFSCAEREKVFHHSLIEQALRMRRTLRHDIGERAARRVGCRPAAAHAQ